MEKMTNYLMNWREDVPSWLASYHPGDQVAFSDFMAGRVGYYPGSYFDGCLIKTANKAHCVHAFLYVDYGVTRERVEQELGRENALLGYHSIGRVEWPYDEILPMGGFQVPLGYIHRVRSRMCVNKGVQPFCIMQIFERNQDKDDSWGAERLALTYLFADGISTYYQLFVMKYNRAPWLFLLQDHGLGGNYDKYGKGGILDGVIHRYNVLPDFVIRDVRSTQMWDGYRPIEGVKTVIGGMHRNPRALYQRNGIINKNNNMKYLKLTDEEYKKASGVIDMLQNQGIGELVEVPDNPQKDNIVEPMILKCRGNDYEVVALEKNGTSNLFFVHELVAATWVPNPQNLPYVRHKNGNTLDNRADNLEWTSDPEAK